MKGDPITRAAPRPPDATLTVTKAARLLGVHPNTIRAWSDQGRLRFYRINARGDRRYRLGDLQRFLVLAEQPAPAQRRNRAGGEGRPVPPIGADLVELRTRPGERADRGTAGTMPDHTAGDADLPADLPAGVPTAEFPMPTQTAVPPQRGSIISLAQAARRARARAAPPLIVPPTVSPLEVERRLVEVDILGRIADLVASGRDLDEVAGTAVELLDERAGHDLVALMEHRDRLLVPLAARGSDADRVGWLADSTGLAGRALAAPGPAHEVAVPDPDWLACAGDLPVRIAVAVPGGHSGPWGILVIADETPAGSIPELETFLAAVARQIGVAVYAERLRAETTTQLHRAAALRQIATDIGSRLDLPHILASVVDHACILFGGDRAAVFLRRADGSITSEVARNLSDGYLAAILDLANSSLAADVTAARRPLTIQTPADDPRTAALRSAAVQEGSETLCVAPLLDGGDLLGLLIVCHDRPHDWDEDERATLDGFAVQAATAIKNAQNYGRMVRWAAHLQSIQQLGTRLARLTTEAEIGTAIANELDQVIEYHNVRVHRLQDDGWLRPVAIRGLVGEFQSETPEDLRIRVGEGITGWVAENRVPQYLPDAARDPRAVTIPGTDDDLDESMLLAPMIFEDRVLGVIVLSRLGLDQFSDDDLRLLTIYASLAAQAVANAESTARLREQSIRLERRLSGQRALLDITASILATLDLSQILDDIADRLAVVVQWDNFSIEWIDPISGTLAPLVTRGIHAEAFSVPWLPGEEGLATWVVAHGEPQLVPDERLDPRVRILAGVGPVEGSLICVPIHGRDGTRGVVSLERLGTGNRYNEDDFELVQLFAAQVSIAIRNAEAYRDKELEAHTDDLTGLLNQRTFAESMARNVESHEGFGLLMLDLDGFKQINDRLGHQAGDEYLRAVARAVRSACRETDRVFRYGGDEFTVICPMTEPAGTFALAERIRAGLAAALTRRCDGVDATAAVSASIGVATYPDDGATADEVLLAADRACFAAKRTGRDRIATAKEGRVLASDLTLTQPTPMDPREVAVVV